jgi:DNA-binding MarR family transcriptional regulator
MDLGFYRAGHYGMPNSVGYLIKRTVGLVQPRMEALFADQELTYSQWTVLMVLREHGGSTAADIARDICHDPGSLTRIIDELESRALVSRQRSGADRRQVVLSLTPKGLALLESLIPRVVEFWNGLLDGFSQTEVKSLIRLLTRLLTAASGQRDKPGPRQAGAPRARIRRSA